MERDLRILREVVETYLDSGEAVGSRTVAERLHGSLSAASIRAVMNDLGQRGLLTQPHTSAGRVPTDLGLRAWLDHVPMPLSPRLTDRRRIERIQWTEGAPVTDVLREAARATASELGVATVVVMPRFDAMILRRVELVLLRPGRALAVAITANGLVHERLLHLAPAIGRAELERFSNFLNELLPGLSLHAVRRRLEEMPRDDLDETGQQAVSLGARAFDDTHAEPEVMIEGAARVLAQRPFTEAPEHGPDLIANLEERSVWLGLLDSLAEADAVRVYVGREAGHEGLAPCAVIATGLGEAGAGLGPGGARLGGARGVVALVGPKRLDYRRVLPWAHLLASHLGQVLAAAG
jgi:heat-inducible transcriptional repressor